MTDRYCVFGNPIKHSKSPLIHGEFASQTHQAMSYTAELAPVEGFADAWRAFIADGGRGANVTVPFKGDAFALCDTLSHRAKRAQAVNTLIVGGNGRTYGDTTDGNWYFDLLKREEDISDIREALIFGQAYASGGALADPRGIETGSTSFATNDVLVLRNAGPIGGPGMPEWGMLPIPKALIKQGHRDMLRISDARMSGTSYGACVLHVAPEGFVGGPLALLKTGDTVRLDLPNRRLDMLVDEEEIARVGGRHTDDRPVGPVGEDRDQDDFACRRRQDERAVRGRPRSRHRFFVVKNAAKPETNESNPKK